MSEIVDDEPGTALCPTCNRYSRQDDWCFLCNPPMFQDAEHRKRWLAMQRRVWPEYVLPDPIPHPAPDRE